jgi:ribonuclease VapC
MFVDTSALVAIATKEESANRLKLAIGQAPQVFTSPMVRLECSIVLADRMDMSIASAEKLFDKFVRDSRIEILTVTDDVGRIAVAAYHEFGKGRHPARLNLADCFSYAMAKSLMVPLLFVGNDFSQTDIKSAL